jgi:hypothetical protein
MIWAATRKDEKSLAGNGCFTTPSTLPPLLVTTWLASFVIAAPAA